MRRIAPLSLLALVLAGCGQAPTPTVTPGPTAADASAPVVSTFTPADGTPAVPAPELSPRERYSAQLWNAFALVTDGKLADALAALEAARAVQDTEQVRQEIARLQFRIQQQQSAERTALDVQAVLTDGRPDEAARLAAGALQQYGATDAADQIVKLKRQADALLGTQVDASIRLTRYRQEGDAAFQAKNLRAAVSAYEQAAQAGADDALRRQLEQLRTTVARYDDLRARAAELRREPTQVEDALTLYQQAAQAWDTPQVRQEIDDCTLALQARRDRLGVIEIGRAHV